MPRPTLSIVIPIFNEEPIIAELHRLLGALLGALPDVGGAWEVVFVDDGSDDRSLAMLKELAAAEPRYRVVSLSRNFGHQLAITAGLDHAEGSAVVMMDADLQDPPEVVRSMLEKWREGYDVVYGVRARRLGETWFKRATAALFYRVLRAMLGGVSIPADAGDFRLMSRQVVLTLRALREKHRFVRGMVAWLGFRQCAVRYERPERFAGETKYPLRKMVLFAMDGITSFSMLPLRLAAWLGLAAGLIAVGVGGWASVQLVMIGILGEYVGRIYEEVKRRPLYLVAEEVNGSEPAQSEAPV